MNRDTRLGLSLLVVAGLLGYMFYPSLQVLVSFWFGKEDYSHGIFVPFISIFFIWQARHRLSAVGLHSFWPGVVVIVIALLLYWVGEFSALFVIQHLALWAVIVGLALSLVGVEGTKEIAFPLSYLLTCIPLPVFLYAGLSSQLQLWSSALGVWCLQILGVTAFREGNVIDLGPVQLQVVEACSGIRYLLPLFSLALLCAYLFKDRMWKRVVLVVSSVPISIVVNGFRIGMIGVLVEWQGQGAAEGFYHLFEGWVLFMASLGLLVGEMWLLAKLDRSWTVGSWRDRFTWECPAAVETTPTQTPMSAPALPTSYLIGVAMLAPVALATSAVEARSEIAPVRASFVDFPMQVKEWTGTSIPLEKQYVDALHLDDYVLAEFRSGDGQPISLYSAYYQSQRKGQSAHSPSSCLPGGGWEVSSFETRHVAVDDVARAISVNRALIQKDRQKQVVLYWFKQRDRVLTNEYLVKFYLLWDSLFRGRTDGALVRVASLVGPGETEAIVDRRLQQFVSTIEPELTRYVPD